MNHVKVIREQAAEDRTFSFEETSPREGKEAFFAALESYIEHWKQEEIPAPAPKPPSAEPRRNAAPSRKRPSTKKKRRA